MNKYKSIVEDIEKNAIDYGKNNHEITLLTQKYFQVSDLYKMLIEKKKAKKHTILINMCIYNHRTTKTNQKYPSVNL